MTTQKKEGGGVVEMSARTFSSALIRSRKSSGSIVDLVERK